MPDSVRRETPIWRMATVADDEAVVAMCIGLYDEDPSPEPVERGQVRRTLDRLRAEPERGRDVVCEVDGRTVGYALLISFWSNELGGEVCNIDERFVESAYRGRGLAADLFAVLIGSEQSFMAGESDGARTRSESRKRACKGALRTAR